ncbi:MAG: leucine-rich repeat domain-containing protein [Ruminococcaceae bacterium]|nr:leucine-rich repeat domain-containing protein [Oscillospiraceae bacterium]
MKRIVRLLESVLLIVLSTAILVTGIHAMRRSLRSELTSYDRRDLMIDPALFAKREVQEEVLEDVLDQMENLIYTMSDEERTRINELLSVFSMQNVDTLYLDEEEGLLSFAIGKYCAENDVTSAPSAQVQNILAQYFGVEYELPAEGSVLRRWNMDESCTEIEYTGGEFRSSAENAMWMQCCVLTAFYRNADGNYLACFDIFEVENADTIQQSCYELKKEAAVQQVEMKYLTSGCAILTQTNENYFVNAYGAVSKGSCGEQVQWEFDHASGTLKIFGQGQMLSYSEWVQFAPWYHFRAMIRSVDIAEGVSSIGDYAFYDCNELREVRLPSSVNSIGAYAFYNCLVMKEVLLPSELLQIGEYAFYACRALRDLRLPEGIETLGLRAFNDCDSLQRVDIPSSLTNLEQAVFSDCDALTCFVVSEKNLHYRNDESGALTDRSGEELICCPSGIEGEYHVADGIKTIQKFAFEGAKKIEQVTLSNSVETIERQAFYRCDALHTLTVGENLQHIEAEAFSACDALSLFAVADGNENFKADRLGVLYDAEMQTLLQCPKAFAGEFVLPNTVKTIADSAFSGCKRLKSIDLNEAKIIGEAAFYDCSALEQITLPQGVQELQRHTFAQCSTLRKVTIPASVHEIGHLAFDGCKELKELYFFGDAPQLAAMVFYCMNEETGEYALIENLTFYRAQDADGWQASEYQDFRIEIWDMQ